MDEIEKDPFTVADLVSLGPGGKLRIRVRYGSFALTYANCVNGTIYLVTDGRGDDI